MNASKDIKMVQLIKSLFSWLLNPYLKIRIKDAVGLDKVSRKCFFWVGTLWEVHKPGYWMIWYDGPIHNFSLGIITIYWHSGVER